MKTSILLTETLLIVHKEAYDFLIFVKKDNNIDSKIVGQVEGKAFCWGGGRCPFSFALG